ncbi:MAG: acyl-CoA dehydrogenase family protein [Deltaproteobacteria bacterium]|nr:acyl-CoA dehydrogenase family protein [Deltaproteobacteria bacterium]
MSYPTRNNPYHFDEFLSWRENVDYYADDPFLQELVRYFTTEEWDQVDAEARAFSQKASFRWRELSEETARPEKRPFLIHYDGHHNRIDRIVRPKETEILGQEVFSEALFSDKTLPWVQRIKYFLISQNGEGCITCPISCTTGLIRLLEKYADSPETKRILQHCKEGINGEFGIGAQYVSEIQGGSDVPANVLEAVNEGGVWLLYGTKFFCSATHADYSVVTAKPTGSEEVALFVVPSWLPGNKEKEIRNGYTIDRIKWKLGTSELITGELTYTGAVAYPVGPLNKGVSNVVGLVLTYSRLDLVLGSAAFMTRAAREATKYAEFRKAFGMPVANFPLVAIELDRINHSAKQTTAGAFKLCRDFLELEMAEKKGQPKKESEEFRRKRFEVRELIMLLKITASLDCTNTIHEAMSIFGGHGVMEDFSSLPRLYRDSAINELWEGPRNVLLTQIHRDLQKAASWYKPADFVRNILKGLDHKMVAPLAAELTELVAHPDLFHPGAKTIEICRRLDAFASNFSHFYQDLALQDLSYGEEREERKLRDVAS